MANAVVARQYGDAYQARQFWLQALLLLDPSSCVSEVTYEADKPKAFDDVVVRYTPSIPRSASARVPVDHYQIKWHTAAAERFGYKDLIDPELIGAASSSLLQRLKQAKAFAAPGSNFTFLTLSRIRDGDPLDELVSGNDSLLRLDRLFDNTTTDNSRMGKVRKAWREHLGLSSNDELRQVLEGFRIRHGERSLDQLREDVRICARAVGVDPGSADTSDFRLDGLARELKARGLNTLDRERLLKFLRDERVTVSPPVRPDRFLAVAIRSFGGTAAAVPGAIPANTLVLTDAFRDRYLLDGQDWQRDIRPRIENFLLAAAGRSANLRITIDALGSVAFLAGATLHTKSGISIELVQKGEAGTRHWRANDADISAASRFDVTTANLGAGREIGVAISVVHDATPAATQYISNNLPEIGRLVSFVLPSGTGQQAVTSGAHAAALAGQISSALRGMKGGDPNTPVHLFAACPNSLLFILGQQYQAIAPVTLYEFDFVRKGNQTYHPSFVLD